MFLAPEANFRSICIDAIPTVNEMLAYNCGRRQSVSAFVSGSAKCSHFRRSFSSVRRDRHERLGTSGTVRFDNASCRDVDVLYRCWTVGEQVLQCNDVETSGATADDYSSCHNVERIPVGELASTQVVIHLRSVQVTRRRFDIVDDQL